jgi:hypothetical protein
MNYSIWRNFDATFSQNVQTDSRAHPTFFSVGTEFFSWWQSCGDVKFTAHLLPASKLRMVGATALLLLYAYVVGRDNVALFILCYIICVTGIVIKNKK